MRYENSTSAADWQQDKSFFQVASPSEALRSDQTPQDGPGVGEAPPSALESKPERQGANAAPSKVPPEGSTATDAATAPSGNAALLDLIMVDKPGVALSNGGGVAAKSLEISQEKIDRIERLEKARKNSQAVAISAAAQGLASIETIERQLRCSRWLVFRRPLTEPEWRLAAANFCGLTHSCEACAVARGGKLLASLVPQLAGVLAESPHFQAHMVTLTVRNSEHLGETYGRLDAAMKKLVDRARHAKTRRVTANPFKSLWGGAGQIETKRGRAGGWHPHYHGVWVFGGRPDYTKIREAWEDYNREPSNLDIRPLESEKLRGTVEYRDALVKDLCEIAKYSLKFESADAAMLWEAAHFYRRQKAHLFRRFGALKGIEDPEQLTDECPNWEAIDYVERIFAWQATHSRYVEVANVDRQQLESGDTVTERVNDVVRVASEVGINY